jgi:hypothetical protein
MNTCTLPTTTALRRPWLQRWRDAAVAAWRGWHEPAGPPQGRIPEGAARRDSSERRAEERSARLADNLDTRLLADIGAPDSMHASAAMRHDRRARQLAELERRAPGGASW